MIGATRIAVAGLLASGVLAAIGAFAGWNVIAVDPPHDALPADVVTFVALLRHNLVVTLWPLALVVLGWAAIPVIRRVGDALVAGQVMLHGAVVGSALVQQPAIWRFLPHLPFEFAALVLPAAAWIVARQAATVSFARALAVALAVVALLVIAALIETYGTPV